MYKTPGRPLLLAETAAFAGLIALGSWISIPFVPVPFTLQTLFVLLSGAVMRRYAVLPTGLYVLMGILGIPVFHSGSAGLGILLGPTGGYILGFIPGAFVTGIFFEHRERAARVLGIVLGDGVIFLCGMSWLSLSTGISPFNAFLIGVLPFIPGDIVKGYAVWLIGERLERVSDTGQEGGSGA
ncbi:MAG: biotin transporter BioY [Methanoregulaceae archaeon]|nr:biotin transporter BioY [Methanoregulaceae archaeon]